MATSYATRISNALAPVTDRVRRWSQSSASDDTPNPRLPAASASGSSTAADDDDSAIQTDPVVDDPHSSPPRQPSNLNTLPTLHEAQAVDFEDSRSEDAFVVVGAAPGLRPPVPVPTLTDPAASLQPPALDDPTILSEPSPPAVPPIEAGNGAVGPAAAARPAPPRSSALPEDDGQRLLRQKLTDITTSQLPERERAQRMHSLMTAKWHASRGTPAVDDPLKSPGFAPVSDVDNPFKLLPGDDKTTYYSGPGHSPDMEELGCAHYRRNNRLQCSTCERWYTCRFCHDEAEDHALVRQQTKNMLCMPCKKPQPAQQDCRYCGTRTAKYYCDKCKLWDDDCQKSIYHCNDCGICRIGKGLGKDFFHCKTCGVCMSIQLQDSHRCIERSTECDCPICGEYMFTSTLTVVFMTCGHSIHHKCYHDHMKSSYRCPTCARTIINMELQFRALDVEIENQPLPDPYDKWRCLISCNDCSAKSNVPFHFLGLKCAICRSYNTCQNRILRPEDHDTPTLPADQGATSPSIANPTTPARTLGVTAPQNQGRSSSFSESGVAASPSAIQAAAEVMESLNLSHGDEDLIADDGWVSESSSDDDEDEDGQDGEGYTDGEESDDDEEEEELINIIGHI